MTDPVVDEIWRLVTAALKGGQKRFHVHVFPFRMTEENLARRERSPGRRSGATSSAATTPSRRRSCRRASPYARGLHCLPPALPPSDGSHEIDNTLHKLDRQQGLSRPRQAAISPMGPPQCHAQRPRVKACGRCEVRHVRRWPLVALRSAWGGCLRRLAVARRRARPQGRRLARRSIGQAESRQSEPRLRPLLGRRPRPPARREGHDCGQPGHDPHLQGRVRARAVAAEGRAASSCLPPIRSASGPGSSAPSCARATGRRPKASIRWAPSSSTSRAASPRSFDLGFPNALDRALRPHRLLHPRARRLHSRSAATP